MAAPFFYGVPDWTDQSGRWYERVASNRSRTDGIDRME